MLHYRIGFLLFILIIIVGCKGEGTVTPPPPEDVAPVVETFSPTQSSIRTGDQGVLNWTARDADSNLDSLVLEFGTGAREVIAGSQASGSRTYIYATAGTFTPKITAWSKGKSGSKSTQIAVGQDLPPIIDTQGLTGAEGSETSVALSSLAHDPEGDPFTFSFVPQAPLNAQVNGTNLVYGLSDPNAFGIYNLTIRVTDPRNRTVERTIPVNIAQRDDLSGVIRDFMEGTYAASRHPEVVIQGPLSGYVKIDGQNVPVDAQGNFVSGKLLNSSHIIESFLTNGVDSSLVWTDTVSAGDRTLNLRVHTNAGTNLSLALYHAFLIEANFGSYFGILRGIDFTNVNAYRLYLAGKDTTMFITHYERLTPIMQDGIEQIVNERIHAELPADKRIAIYKAAQGESIPILPDGRPPSGTAWVFKNNNSGGVGTFAGYDHENDGIIEAAEITLFNTGGTEPPAFGFYISAVIQEVLSWYCAPLSVVSPPFAYKTCLHGLRPTDYMTGLDIKLLYTRVYDLHGLRMSAHWKMPQ